MNREQMIETAAEVIWCRHGGTPTDPYDDHRLPIPLDCFDDASAVVDAILPQVTTVEGLVSLPHYTLLVTNDGREVRWSWREPESLERAAQRLLEVFGPLTVVWQPE